MASRKIPLPKSDKAKVKETHPNAKAIYRDGIYIIIAGQELGYAETEELAWNEALLTIQRGHPRQCPVCSDTRGRRKAPKR